MPAIRGGENLWRVSLPGPLKGTHSSGQKYARKWKLERCGYFFSLIHSPSVETATHFWGNLIWSITMHRENIDFVKYRQRSSIPSVFFLLLLDLKLYIIYQHTLFSIIITENQSELYANCSIKIQKLPRGNILILCSLLAQTHVFL